MYLESAEVQIEHKGLTFRKTAFRSKQAFEAMHKADWAREMGYNHLIVQDNEAYYYLYLEETKSEDNKGTVEGDLPEQRGEGILAPESERGGDVDAGGDGVSGGSGGSS